MTCWQSVLIDSINRTVTPVSISFKKGDYGDFNRRVKALIGCDMYCQAMAPGGHVILVDDEGLFKAEGLFALNQNMQPLPNKGLLFKAFRDDYRSCKYTASEVEAMVRFYPKEDVGRIAQELINSVRVVGFDSIEDAMKGIFGDVRTTGR